MLKDKSPLAVAIAAESLLTSAAAGADDASLTTQIVDTFYKIYGTPPGIRASARRLRKLPLRSRLFDAAKRDGTSPCIANNS